jgi:FeS assembly SUF system protein
MDDATLQKDSETSEPSPPELSVTEAILMQDKVVEVLKGCYDPEIPVNIYDLGLIYEVKVDRNGVADVRMTLTSPSCPAAGMLPGEIEYKVREIPGIKDVRLDLVWDPPWDTSKMSEAARLQLGMW